MVLLLSKKPFTVSILIDHFHRSDNCAPNNLLACEILPRCLPFRYIPAVPSVLRQPKEPTLRILMLQIQQPLVSLLQLLPRVHHHMPLLFQAPLFPVQPKLQDPHRHINLLQQGRSILCRMASLHPLSLERHRRRSRARPLDQVFHPHPKPARSPYRQQIMFLPHRQRHPIPNHLTHRKCLFPLPIHLKATWANRLHLRLFIHPQLALLRPTIYPLSRYSSNNPHPQALGMRSRARLHRQQVSSIHQGTCRTLTPRT